MLFETIGLSLPKFVWLRSLSFLIMKKQSVASIVWQAICVIVFSKFLGVYILLNSSVDFELGIYCFLYDH